MARPLRIERAKAWYHVTGAGLGTGCQGADDAAIKRFEKRLSGDSKLARLARKGYQEIGQCCKFRQPLCPNLRGKS